MTRTRVSTTIFALVGLFTAISPFVFDWNHTHINNPNWPPHAKFHDAQTMAIGVLLGAATLYFAFRRSEPRTTNVLAAALFASFYWISQAAANLFPGVAWTDPEFLHPGQTLHQFAPQQMVDIVVLTLVAAATWLGRSN